MTWASRAVPTPGQDRPHSPHLRRLVHPGVAPILLGYLVVVAGRGARDLLHRSRLRPRRRRRRPPPAAAAQSCCCAVPPRPKGDEDLTFARVKRPCTNALTGISPRVQPPCRRQWPLADRAEPTNGGGQDSGRHRPPVSIITLLAAAVQHGACVSLRLWSSRLFVITLLSS